MIQNKVYLVVNPEKDTVEYTIFVPGDEDIYVLRRSSDTQWQEHVRDEVVLTIFNSGDGYKIKWKESSKNKLLDYSQSIELTILLNFINTIDRHPFKYKFVDSDELVDLM